MELAKRWLDSQKSLPSFVNASNNDPSAESVLDRPMPAALSPQRRAVTPVAVSRHSLHHHSTRAVHEDLVAKGLLYSQRKEALREKAVKEEMRHYRAVPKVSMQARMLRREDPIEKRFEKLQREKEEQRRFDLMKLDEKDESEHAAFHYKPKISNRGRRATSRLMLQSDQHEAWLRRREEKLESERLKWVGAQMAEVHDTPDINPHSERLAARRREKEGLAGMSHIDAMIERDRLKRLSTWEQQQAQSMSQNTNPKITTFAAALPRSGDVGDRLFQQAFEQEERRAERMRQRLERDAMHTLHSPRITGVAASQPRQLAVEDELMQRHLDSLAQKEFNMRKHLDKEQERHTPAINPVSDAIVARLQQTSKERLLEPKATYVDLSRDEPPKTARSVSAASRSTSATSSQRDHERSEMLHRAHERRKQRLEELKKAQEEKEMAECTFQPEIHHEEAADAGGDLMDRSAQWSRRREMKLHEQRQQRSNQELAACTFTPKTHSSHRRAVSNEPSDTIYGGDGKAWGVDDFIERQREARRRRELEEARVHETGHRWRNAPTKPEEFELGRRAGVRGSIHSLNPPATAQPLSVDLEAPMPPTKQFGHAVYEQQENRRPILMPAAVKERFGV